MSADPSADIVGEYRRLMAVPKQALVDLLASANRRAEARSALDAIGHGDLSPTIADLASLCQRDLILLAQACPSVTEERARALYEDHLYTGMKSLYLYELLGAPEALAGDHGADQLAETIATMIGEPEREDIRATDLRMRGLEAIGTDSGTVLEVSYSYTGYVRRINPDNEYPESLKDLRRGFMWVSVGNGWMVVCARDESTAVFLAAAIEQWLGIQARRLPVPKSVLRLVQPDEAIRRIALVDPKTKTRRRWTGARMSRDQTAMAEIMRRRDADHQSTAGYNEELPDGGRFALGYTGTVGRMYFSRHLTVTQMREWGPRKMTELVQAIGSERRERPGAMARELTSQVLTYMRKGTREVVGEIAAALLYCKSSGNSEVRLDFDALEALRELGTRVDADFLVECQRCGQLSEIQCACCYSTDFVARQGTIGCAHCENSLAPGEIHCAEDYDHRIEVAELADIVTLTPTSNLFDALVKLAHAVGISLGFGTDLFTIGGRTLHYLPAGETRYSIDDIPELAWLLADSIPEAEIRAITARLGDFREACEHPTSEMCATCVQTRQGGPCFQRLFALFDPEHTPQPHSGSEYGDYSRWVTLESGRVQLVVAMKSGHPSGRAVTRRSRKGLDIHSQVLPYLTDAKISFFGICLPQQLHPRFVATLVAQAEYYGKKLLIIERRDLARIAYSVMSRCQLSLDDI